MLLTKEQRVERIKDSVRRNISGILTKDGDLGWPELRGFVPRVKELIVQFQDEINKCEDLIRDESTALKGLIDFSDLVVCFTNILNNENYRVLLGPYGIIKTFHQYKGVIDHPSGFDHSLFGVDDEQQ